MNRPSGKELFPELQPSDDKLTWVVPALFGALAVFILWAALFKLDVVSIAEGEVIPAEKVQNVAHLEGGVISAMLVREGDVVSPGQALVELESTDSGASVAELRLKIVSDSVDVIRLEALLKGETELTFPGDLAGLTEELQQKSRRRFQSQRDTLTRKLSVQSEEVKRRTKERSATEARLANQKDRVLLLEEQVAISERLMEADVSSRYEHLNLLKELNGLESEIAQDEASLQAADAGILQA